MASGKWEMREVKVLLACALLSSWPHGFRICICNLGLRLVFRLHLESLVTHNNGLL